ncbi:MAG: hypothetical protein QM726_20315 [Chitinophagaceae bacterium]
MHLLQKSKTLFMKSVLPILLIIFCAACTGRPAKLLQSGEISFRITMNENRDLSDEETDSLERSNPTYGEDTNTNDLYKQLERGGFVAHGELDIAKLNLSLISWGEPTVSFGDTQVQLDTSNYKDELIVRSKNTNAKINLGPRLLGDIFCSVVKIDNEPKFLVVEKYYVMGGYNFDIKIFELE